jgi:cell division protein FtsI/penicillin-binding protein 2
MHAELSEASRRTTPLAEFSAAYRRASAKATATALSADEAQPSRDGVVEIPMAVRTRVWGPVQATLRLPFDESGDDPRIEWSRHLTFPGVQRGSRLERRTQLPARADLLARDGRPLAEGPQRTSTVGEAASSIVGSIEDPPPERAARLRELGFPSDAKVGVSGLERVFDEQLAGKPGGVLRAGGTLLASSRPQAGKAVRTTIDPAVQRAAVAALGERLGGIAAVRPINGEILALAGVAFSGLSAPGSTFKIVTLTGALQAGVTGPKSSYPVETKTEIEGVELENANGESCGGSLRLSFAHSCNTVFAPLGAKLGAKRLVRAAEAFGFNEDLGIPGAARSTIPAAGEIGDDLAVGSSAIGQGRVQSTALQMSLVAATIAGRGQRPQLTLQLGRPAQRKQVVPARTARIVGRYMESVVKEGTGTAAAITGIRVAGKTGTAELRTTVTPTCTPTPEAPDCPPALPDDPTDTNAWFAAYAPAGAPRVAIGVLLVASGLGGKTAAPVAKQVLLSALKATR